MHKIVKRSRRAFSLLVNYFVLSRSRRRRRHGLLRSCRDHNRAIDLRPFRISELAYFQGAMKLSYCFQLVIERMSSLSS